MFIIIHSSLLPFELGILQLYSQGSAPFKTHQFNMWIFMVGKSINIGAGFYYVECWFTKSRCPKICDQIGYISGSLAYATFLSILVPKSLQPLIFIIWVLHSPLYIGGVRKWILNMTQKLHNYLSNGAIYVCNIWNNIIGSNN